MKIHKLNVKSNIDFKYFYLKSNEEYRIEIVDNDLKTHKTIFSDFYKKDVSAVSVIADIINKLPKKFNNQELNTMEMIIETDRVNRLF